MALNKKSQLLILFSFIKIIKFLCEIVSILLNIATKLKDRL